MKQTHYFIKQHFRLIYAFLVVGSILLYLLLTAGHSFWVDEAYTLAMVRHSFSEIWKITAADVHPPLYYILLKIFLIPFGNSMLMAEIFSCLPFVLIIAVGGIRLRELFDEETAVLFMVLFFLFPYTMSYAVEIRMYSLAALFVFLTAIYAFCCQREGSTWWDWGLCAFFGACCAYTHYFALVSAGILYGLLLLAVVFGKKIEKKRLIKNWILMAVLTILLYLPWLKCFIGQLVYKVNHEYWISPVTAKTVLRYAYEIFSSKGVFAFVLFGGACYAAALIYMAGRRNKEEILIALGALAVPCGTILVGVAASVLIRPVFVIRYCIPALPLLVFFMAFVMGKMSDDILLTVFLTVFLIGGIGNYGKMIISGVRTQRSGLDALLSDGYDIPKSVVVYDNDSPKHFATHAAGVLAWYYPEVSVYRSGSFIAGASPYGNLYAIETFRGEADEPILLLTESGQPVPENFEADYSCRYLGEADQYEYLADVYLLTAE